MSVVVVAMSPSRDVWVAEVPLPEAVLDGEHQGGGRGEAMSLGMRCSSPCTAIPWLLSSCG